MNKSSVFFPAEDREGGGSEEEAVCGRKVGVLPDALNLWEDRALAGFTPLKANLSTKDTFALPQLKMMDSKVGQANHAMPCQDRAEPISKAFNLCLHANRENAKNMDFFELQWSYNSV